MEKKTTDWKNFLLYILAIVGAFIILALFFSKEKSIPNQTQNESTQSASMTGKYSSPPEMGIDTNKKYSASVTTNYGNFTFELFTKETPITVNNFVFLANDGFYNGTVFHRIIKGFMIQGGDPQGDGTGGPGYSFADEPINRDYKRGIVAMANSGPNTNGSQFFIMHQDNNLPKNYVIFGQITKGMETIDKIVEVEVETNSQGEPSKPKTKVTINNITINEN